MMSIGFLFWLLMLLWLVLGIWQSWPHGEGAKFAFRPFGVNLLLFVLLALLGWHIFGPPIHG